MIIGLVKRKEIVKVVWFLSLCLLFSMTVEAQDVCQWEEYSIGTTSVYISSEVVYSGGLFEIGAESVPSLSPVGVCGPRRAGDFGGEEGGGTVEGGGHLDNPCPIGDVPLGMLVLLVLVCVCRECHIRRVD